jgi:hypothetical protein
MSKEIIFTRYLYEKTEVEIALILSLLAKKEEEALFWAYELYYSGFQSQLIHLLWKIYFDFYASMNLGFQTYLLKKLTQKKGEEELKMVGSIIQNFIIRPFNLDVFMLKQIQDQFEVPTKEKNMETLQKETSLDYESLLQIVFNTNEKDILTLLDDKKKKEWKKIEKAKLPIDKKTIMLAYLLHEYGVKQKKPMGKNIYIHSDQSDFEMYQTLEVDLTPKENKRVPKLPAYQVLPLVTSYSIYKENNESTFLSLFEIQREKGGKNKREAYLSDWLYYASRSPIWLERIKRYGGAIIPENNNNKVFFENEEKEEDFYEHYSYEPDEQKKEVQERTVQEISTNNKASVSTFYQAFSKKSFFEMEEEYLEQMKII